MSVGDWKLEKSHGQTTLAHQDAIHCSHTKSGVKCGIFPVTKLWHCLVCREVAPKEIQFAADLCNCKDWYPWMHG